MRRLLIAFVIAALPTVVVATASPDAGPMYKCIRGQLYVCIGLTCAPTGHACWEESNDTAEVVATTTSGANVMRCLGSNMSGHRTHDHWHVWTGTSAGKWYDTGREC